MIKNVSYFEIVLFRQTNQMSLRVLQVLSKMFLIKLQQDAHHLQNRLVRLS